MVVEISSLDNTAVNQGAETEGTVMSEGEDNNTDSIVTTEVGVSMSTRQLHDLLINALSAFKTEIVTIIETNNSNLRSDLDSKTTGSNREYKSYDTTGE